jgi:hypothetical protein
MGSGTFSGTDIANSKSRQFVVKSLLSQRPEALGELARICYAVGRSIFPNYAHRYSPKKFTQPQLAGLVILGRCMAASYRDLVWWIDHSPQLRAALALRRTPCYSTLCHAERRLSATHAEIFSDEVAILIFAKWLKNVGNGETPGQSAFHAVLTNGHKPT